jgi:hypothetical protein
MGFLFYLLILIPLLMLVSFKNLGALGGMLHIGLGFIYIVLIYLCIITGGIFIPVAVVIAYCTLPAFKRHSEISYVEYTKKYEAEKVAKFLEAAKALPVGQVFKEREVKDLLRPWHSKPREAMDWLLMAQILKCDKDYKLWWRVK